MPRPRHSPPEEETDQPDVLAAAVTRLGDEVRSLFDVLDRLRDDISWVTRNGLPVQPVEHTVVKRMARDPCDAAWNEKLELQRFTTTFDLPAWSQNPDAIDRISADLRIAFEAIAEGQLELVLGALDAVRDEIVRAIERSRNAADAEDVSPAIDKPEGPGPGTAPAQRKSPRGGRLF